MSSSLPDTIGAKLEIFRLAYMYIEKLTPKFLSSSTDCVMENVSAKFALAFPIEKRSCAKAAGPRVTLF